MTGLIGSSPLGVCRWPSSLGVCCYYDGLDRFHLLWVYVVADYDGFDMSISSGCMSLLTKMGLICLSPLGVCRC